MTTLFVSDIHLNAAEPAITAQFLDFLQGEARVAEQLYILGDLFEFWIGDDDGDATYGRIQQALRALTDSGVPVKVMHGNRDFLLGSGFCRRTGCTLIEDGTVIELYGQRVLLMHGDVLCTDDHAYQRLRRIVRNPVVQWLFRRLSLARRERLATRIRQGSQQHTRKADYQIMDVNADAVTQAFSSSHTTVMVHGHTHRAAIHVHPLTSGEAVRIVLGDWHHQGSVLRWNADGYELVTLPR